MLAVVFKENQLPCHVGSVHSGNGGRLNKAQTSGGRGNTPLEGPSSQQHGCRYAKQTHIFLIFTKEEGGRRKLKIVRNAPCTN